MRNSGSTVLSIAVSSGKIGYVFLIDGELSDWGIASKASRTMREAEAKAREWFKRYEPDLIVTERLTLHTRKRGKTIQNIDAIAEAAQSAKTHHVEVERIQTYANKYEEIQALAKRYPVIANWAPPKRKFWQTEEKNTVLFEALSLSEKIR